MTTRDVVPKTRGCSHILTDIHVLIRTTPSTRVQNWINYFQRLKTNEIHVPFTFCLAFIKHISIFSYKKTITLLVPYCVFIRVPFLGEEKNALSTSFFKELALRNLDFETHEMALHKLIFLWKMFSK